MISTSKIRKIIAIRKKRREKGRRADPLGSNPHSNGELFSRSIMVFFDRIEDKSITIVEIRKIKRIKMDRDAIIFPEFSGLLIGSQLYYVY